MSELLDRTLIVMCAPTDAARLEAEKRLLQTENARLRAALELFVADENWTPELSDSDEFPPRAFWSGPFDPQGIAARALRGE